MTNEKPSKETLEKWHQDPSNWRLGVFYYNKEDKRIFPPKRFKALGWTVNFANPRSYGFFIIILVLFIAFMQCIK
jgi:uncharacterized membrane protein